MPLETAHVRQDVVVNAGFLLNMEAVVESYNYPKCEKCGEDKNMYGGCRCNGYTTAFNAVENQLIPQHGQPKICAVCDDEMTVRDIFIKRDQLIKCQSCGRKLQA